MRCHRPSATPYAAATPSASSGFEPGHDLAPEQLQGARSCPGSKPEDALGVAAAYGVALGRWQRIDACQAALHVADVVRVVRAVQQLVFPADADAELQGFLLEHHAVVVNFLQV